MSFAKDAIGTLKANGYKMTAPRKAVIEAFSRLKKASSPYDIQKKLSTDTHLSAVTIYRIIELFESLNLVHKVGGSKGYLKCSIPKEKGCHHFMICQDCGDTKEYVDHSHHDKPMAVKNAKFTVKKHHLELHGLCKKCN